VCGLCGSGASRSSETRMSQLFREYTSIHESLACSRFGSHPSTRIVRTWSFGGIVSLGGSPCGGSTVQRSNPLPTEWQTRACRCSHSQLRSCSSPSVRTSAPSGACWRCGAVASYSARSKPNLRPSRMYQPALRSATYVAYSCARCGSSAHKAAQHVPRSRGGASAAAQSARCPPCRPWTRRGARGGASRCARRATRQPSRRRAPPRAAAGASAQPCTRGWSCGRLLVLGCN